MNHKMINGVYTALITPFKNNKIDENSFSNLIEKQISAKIDGIVLCGSTGESQTLSIDEHKYLVKLGVSIANNRIKIMASAGSSSTDLSVNLARYSESVGADSLMISAPSYNRPTQSGIFNHYKNINDSVSIPIIIYNVPIRTSVDICDETIIALSELDNIIGIKDASGNLSRPLSLSARIKKPFFQLSGDDITALAFNAQGGVGCVSVLSNIAPELCLSLQKLWNDGFIKQAQDLNKKLYPLYKALFIEINPSPIKYAASLIGLCENELRLPLLPISEDNQNLIENTLNTVGII